MNNTTNSESTIRICQFNVNCSNTTANHANLTWDSRFDKIMDVISSVGAQIFLFQELRDLAGAKHSLSNFVDRVLQLGYAIALEPYLASSNKKFFLGIAYSIDRFECAGTTSHKIFDHDIDRLDIMGRHIYMTARLYDKVENRRITVLNTHLSMEEDRTRAEVQELAERCKTIQEPFVCAGDFNTFNDGQGPQIRELLTSLFQDAFYPIYQSMDEEKIRTAYPVVNSCRPERRLSGTFYGFSYDRFKKHYSADNTGFDIRNHEGKALAFDTTPENAVDSLSRLDHCFIKGLEVIGKAYAFIIANTADPLSAPERDDQPSDHFPVMCDVKYQNNA